MNQTLKIRTVLVLLLFSSLYLVVLAHLYSIQIKHQDFYKDLATKQYQHTITTMPPRASIFDRHGEPLALNQDQLSAFVLPKELKQPDQLKKFLKKNFPQALERLQKNEGHFVYIKRRLTPEQLTLIQQAQIEDIHILKEPSRYYPLECASPIVGITDIDNVGLIGIEALYNQQLAGTSSTYILKKDARSGHFYIEREAKVVGQDGTPITLTLDSDLQFLASEELKQTVEEFQAQEGAVLVMNPTTGELLALTTYPTFNSNNTIQLDMSLTKNKLVTETHEPGSVMKVFLALAALEEGVVTAEELIDCGNMKIGVVNGVKFSTVHPEGVIPFSDVIAFSNNFGVAKVALRLGPKLYDHYTRMGFGKKTALNWPGEQKGFVNPPNNWSRPSIISLSFGYEITATLLQLALAFSMVANDGYLVQPRIIKTNERPIISEKPLYSPQTITTMRDILEKAVAKGTGQRAAIKGYKVLGKTGTAKLVIDGKYSDTRNIYTFMGIVEKGDYKRLIVTFVKDSPKKMIYASTVAAPLFEKIVEKLLIHDKII